METTDKIYVYTITFYNIGWQKVVRLTFKNEDCAKAFADEYVDMMGGECMGYDIE